MVTAPDVEGPDAPYPQDESPWAEVSVRRIEALNIGLLAAIALGGLWVSQAFALGVVAGGLLMIANFRIIVGVIRSVFLKGSHSALNVGLYWFKFMAFMALVGMLVAVFQVDAIGVLTGLSVIVLAILVEGVLRLVGK